MLGLNATSENSDVETCKKSCSIRPIPQIFDKIVRFVPRHVLAGNDENPGPQSGLIIGLSSRNCARKDFML